jgi:hypothetical protein
MAGKKTSSKSSTSHDNTKQATSRERIAKLIDQAIDELESKLADKTVTVSLADCLKVLQLQKEFEDDQPTEVRVTWVDPEPRKEI